MSPVIFPDGFTRDFIDGKVTEQELVDKIREAHENLYNESDFLVCEGTGHTGVGSICELNNAQVACTRPQSPLVAHGQIPLTLLT
jgi:phosphate acetyltransferase